MVLWAAASMVVVVVAWSIRAYNRLVGLQKRAQGAWADIDAQLKRRHDLVPALVETVKGYARHEQGTLREVIEQRGAASRMADVTSPNAATVGATESLLTGALRGVFALAEAYPDLRASERFGQLMEELTDIEEHLQNARRYYNAVVRDQNTAIARFPDLVIARLAGFEAGTFFEIVNALDRQVVEVSLHE